MSRVLIAALACFSMACFAEGLLPPSPTLLCAPYPRIVISGWGVDLVNIGGTPLTQVGSWAQYAVGQNGGIFNAEPSSLGAYFTWFLQSWDGVPKLIGEHCPEGTRYVSMPVNDYEGLILSIAVVTELQNGWNMAAIGLAALCVLLGFFMGYKMFQRGGSQ